jgi:hypothetical protein
MGDLDSFYYENTEMKIQSGGKKVVRKVTVKRGSGYKIVTKYANGKKVVSVKKKLKKPEIVKIKRGKFIPGLFDDCVNCKTRKRRK